MTDYLDADLDDAQQRRVLRHVRFCPRCRRVLGNLRITIDRLSGLGSTPTVESNDEEAITARIAQSWRGQRE